MFFSICIPQYNRYAHLRLQLIRLQEQSCQDFEVCISDDRSPEAGGDELQAWLKGSGLRHVYVVQETNLRYDANLRAAIALATGKYVLLMGNDDRLAAKETLAQLKARLEAAGLPEVALTNFFELSSKRTFERVTHDGQMVSGLDAALATYRNYSLVSGILMLREQAVNFATSRWDGSEMYQMALATRVVASGGRLLGVAEVAVEKDIPVAGNAVESYANKGDMDVSLSDWWRGTKQIPLVHYAVTAWDAMALACPAARGHEVRFQIVKQTLLAPYAYWLFQYKKVFGFKQALGLALAMRGRFLLAGFPDDRRLRIKVWGLHGGVSALGLLIPAGIFARWEPKLYALFKRATWKSRGGMKPVRSGSGDPAAENR